MPFGTEVGLTLGAVVLDVDPLPLLERAQLRCGQTAEWTNMPLGMGVGYVV